LKWCKLQVCKRLIDYFIVQEDGPASSVIITLIIIITIVIVVTSTTKDERRGMSAGTTNTTAPHEHMLIKDTTIIRSNDAQIEILITTIAKIHSKCGPP